MPRRRVKEGASRRGAPFSLLALLFPLLAAAGCPADRVDETVHVEYVYDGDTVRLADGRKVRFIGIDTPEIGRDGAPSQPYAQEARTAVERLLRQAGNRLMLRFGSERQDRYGRTLAHPYLPGGESLNARLLAEGLATALIVPPNLWGYPCYRKAEQEALAAREGIWDLPRYQVLDSRTLLLTTTGFRRVAGRVERVGSSRRSLWLNLDGPVAVRIPKEDLVYFDEPERLEGKRVVVRGWLHRQRDRLMMTVRHPADLALGSGHDFVQPPATTPKSGMSDEQLER